MTTTAQQVSRSVLAQRICRRKHIPVVKPFDLVCKVLNLSDRPAVAFSGGKASLVALHMAWLINPNIDVIFNNTGVEHPKTIQYVKELTDRWGLNITETQPIKTFWQCVEEYGFPQIRGGKDSKSSATKRNTRAPACCRLLKERPAVLAYRSLGIDTIFTGIQASESRVRFLSACERGQYFYSKKWRLFRCNPITFWTDAELWEYIRSNDLPYNPLYDEGHDRVGCLPCTGHLEWQKKMAKTSPKLLRYILEKQGQPGLDRWLLMRFSQPPCDGGALS